MSEQVSSTLRDGMFWVTLERADKANAMTVDMMERVHALISQAMADPAVRAILLTGSGERVFCAGVDIREKPADGDSARQRERRSHALASLQDLVMEAPKPVVVVLNGAAIGGGAMLALMADSCVAADDASLSLPEIDIGIPTFSGASILEAIGGRALALDLIQTARRISASEAAARGLVHALAPRAELTAVATATADRLGAKDPKAFAANKSWLNRTLKAALSEAREQHARHRAAPALTGTHSHG